VVEVMYGGRAPRYIIYQFVTSGVSVFEVK